MGSSVNLAVSDEVTPEVKHEEFVREDLDIINLSNYGQYKKSITASPI